MSAAALANWPHVREDAQAVSAKERETAGLLSLTGIWLLWKKNPADVVPVFCGSTDIRELAEKGCKSPDYYIWLAPHNNLMDGETTDDPLPYLCYPLDPKYAAQNRRDRKLFAEVEAAKAGRVAANLSLMSNALKRLEALNERLDSLASSG